MFSTHNAAETTRAIIAWSEVLDFPFEPQSVAEMQEIVAEAIARPQVVLQLGVDGIARPFAVS